MDAEIKNLKQAEKNHLAKREKESGKPKKDKAVAQAVAPVVDTINTVESDEIFTAGQGKFALAKSSREKRHETANTGAGYEDRGNKLETRSNSENVAENMIRAAETRGWEEIKVSGTKTFRREAWLEAEARGIHVKGYIPTEQDKQLLVKRTNSRTPDRIRNKNHKRMAEAFSRKSSADAAQQYPELAGVAAALMAISKKAEADGLTPEQLAIVVARARQNVADSIERGKIPNVKIRKEMVIEVKPEAFREQDYSR
jgi:hypothetical protein